MNVNRKKINPQKEAKLPKASLSEAKPMEAITLYFHTTLVAKSNCRMIHTVVFTT